MQDHFVVLLRITEAIYRRDGRDYDRVATLKKCLGRRQTHLLDMLIDRCVLLDEQITRWHIGLWLVVVVVGDEILDGVIREKLFEFTVELRRQSFVRGQYDGRTLLRLYQVGYREGLT